MTAGTFHAATERVLTGWLREFYLAGWQPTELVRFARMHRKSAGELMRAAIAVERSRRTGPTAQDPAWAAQWAAAELPENVPDRGWVATWAESVPSGQSVRELFEFASVLGTLGQLQLLLPPPAGSAKPVNGQPARGTTDPILGRVRALLAKAESTEHESEAMAFTAKAQELMTKHAIDLAMVESRHESAEAPRLVRIPIDPPYLDAKSLLLHAVAVETRCRTIVHDQYAMASVIGFAADLEAVELLFTSLLVQAQQALTQASAAAPPGSRTRSQGFRSAFLQGFAGRIGQRLAEVNELAYAGADSEVFLPVLRSRDDQVDDFITEQFPRMKQLPVRGGYDREGFVRGQQAGDAAALTSGAVSD